MLSLKQHQKGMVGIAEIGLGVILIAAMGFVVWRVSSADKATSDANFNAVTASEGNVESLAPLSDDLSEILDLDSLLPRAANEIGGAKLVGVDLENEDLGIQYKLSLSDGRVLRFDAMTGTLLGTGSHDDPDEEIIPANTVFNVSLSEALKTANKQNPHKKLEKVEVELEDGKVVYSFRYTDDSRVDVDVASGAVVRTKVGGQADENEKDDDSDDDSDSRSGSGSDSNDEDDDGDNSESDNDDEDESDDDDDSSDDEDDEEDDDEDNSGPGSGN